MRVSVIYIHFHVYEDIHTSRYTHTTYFIHIYISIRDVYILKKPVYSLKDTGNV